MSDLISREDAIDAVCEWGTNEERKGNLTATMVYVKQCVADILSALPSVELPAEAEFTDLPDIPRYYYEKVVGNMAHEINMLKEQLESTEAVQGEWTPFDRTFGRSIWVCSACKSCTDVPCDAFTQKPIYEYCPNCGARMKGGAE